jgi:pyridoxal 5'-phosphate synthase pdxT subunit
MGSQASGRRSRVGVLALQGDVREHLAAIREVGAEPVEVRLPRDLAGLDALILPGGESTTMRTLINLYGLREPILALAAAGAPMLGTCAGMILLADRIADGDVPVFRLLDVEVRRNAYGRQLDSFEAEVSIPELGDEPMHGVFIRAPIVSEVGPGAEVLAVDDDGRPIAVRQGNVLATSFHPELTGDRRLHRLLVEMVGAGAGARGRA